MPRPTPGQNPHPEDRRDALRDALPDALPDTRVRMTAPDPSRPTAQVRDLGRLAYEAALEIQRQTHAAVVRGDLPGALLLVEHDPVVTLGRRGNRDGILQPEQLRSLGIHVLHSERGGDVTYHGPGQLVAYPILNLRTLRLDVRSYVLALEGAALRLLQHYGIEGRRDPDMHGVFVAGGKIASVGVHVSRGVTRHGIAINIDPIAEHWQCIAPCGQPGVAAVSLRAAFQPALQTGLPRVSSSPPPSADLSMSTVKREFVRAFAAEFALDLSVEDAPRDGA